MDRHDKKTLIRLVILLSLGALLYFITNIQRVGIPGSIFSELQTDLSLNAVQVASLGAVFMYIYGMSQFFVGFLTDSIGGIRVLMIGAILFGIGSILFPIAPNLTLLYLCRGFVGFGASLFYVSLIQTVSKTFPKQFTVLMGWFLLIGCLGAIAANAPFVFCVQQIGWVNTLLILGIISAVMGLIVLLAGFPVSGETARKIRFDLKIFPAVFKNRNNIKAYLALGLCFGIYYVIQTVVGKKFLEDFCGMDSIRSAMVLSVMGFCTAAANFLCVYVCRAIGNRRKPFFIMTPLVTACVTLLISVFVLFEYRTNLIIPLFWLLGYFTNIAPVNLTFLREINPEGQYGTTVSCGNGIAYLSVAVLGSVAGICLDLFPAELINGILTYGTKSYAVLFLFLFLVSIPALICGFCVPETRNVSEEKGR